MNLNSRKIIWCKNSIILPSLDYDYSLFKEKEIKKYSTFESVNKNYMDEEKMNINQKLLYYSIIGNVNGLKKLLKIKKKIF